jgi:hypothetical protein
MGLKHHGRERKWSTTRFRTWSDPRGIRTLPNSVLHLPRSSTSRDCLVEVHLSPTFNVLNRAMRRVSILGQSPGRSIAIAGPVLKADDETLRLKAEANGRSWSCGFDHVSAPKQQCWYRRGADCCAAWEGDRLLDVGPHDVLRTVVTAADRPLTVHHFVDRGHRNK